MNWNVEFTDEFEVWWNSLAEVEQNAVARMVRLLEERGPSLGWPQSSGIAISRHPHMRELRAQCRGRPIRMLYAFDPRRYAILLIGGRKKEADRWYERFVPIADDLYDVHLETLKREGLL